MSEIAAVMQEEQQTTETEKENPLLKNYSDLLQLVDTPVDSLPKEYLPSPDKPQAKEQQFVIEGLCNAGGIWKTHEIEDFLSRVAGHKETLADAIRVVQSFKTFTRKIETAEERANFKARMKDVKAERLKRERSSRESQEKERKSAWHKLMTRAGWSRFVALSISSLGRDKSAEGDKKVAAYTYTDTRAYEGVLPDSQTLEVAIAKAANMGFQVKDNEGNNHRIKLPLVQYHGQYTEESRVRVLDARNGEDLVLPDGPIDILVIRCDVGKTFDLPVNIRQHPMVMYIAEDKSEINSSVGQSKSRVILSTNTVHEGGDEIHIAGLAGRIRDMLKLSDLAVISKNKIKEYGDWNRDISKPHISYNGDYVPENIAVENYNVKTYLDFLNEELIKLGVVVKDTENKKNDTTIKFNEALVLISGDILASRTGSYETMGHLLYSPNIEKRLHHLRGEGTLSMMQLTQLINEKGETEEGKEEINALIENLRQQRKVHSDGKNDNMRFLEAASRYPRHVQQAFNYVARKYWNNGMEKIIGRHLESIIPNQMKKATISGSNDEEAAQLKNEYFSFGIGIAATPAIIDEIQTGACTMATNKEILIVDENGNEYNGFTNFSVKYKKSKPIISQ